jgi:hypothetical protein
MISDDDVKYFMNGYEQSLAVNKLHLISSYIQGKIIKNGSHVYLRFKSSGMWYCQCVSSAQNFLKDHTTFIFKVKGKVMFILEQAVKAQK